MPSELTSFAIPKAPMTVPQWFGRNTEICVQGLSIKDPFVFCGRKLPGPWCAAIDIELPARADGLAGRPGVTTYAHLTARQRLAYLNWLASGRRAKLTEKTLLVAFIANSEQFLLDNSVVKSPEDEVDILVELLQLARAYRTSFPDMAAQCMALRDYVWVRKQALLPDVVSNAHVRLSILEGAPPGLALRWLAGASVAQTNAVSAEIAYLFGLSYLTTKECQQLMHYEQKLATLFLYRFKAKFGNNLTLPDGNIAFESVSYFPLGTPLRELRFRLNKQAPLLKNSQTLRIEVNSIMSACLIELRDYVAAVTTDITEDAAWHLLPPVVWPQAVKERFRALIQQALTEPTIVSFKAIASYFGAGAILTIKNLKAVTEGLAQLGLAVYPPLLVQKPTNIDAPIALYEQDTIAALNVLDEPLGETWAVLLRLLSLAATDNPVLIPQRLVQYWDVDHSLLPELKNQRRAAAVWAIAGGGKLMTPAQWMKESVETRSTAIAHLGQMLSPLADLGSTPKLDKLLGTAWTSLRVQPLTLDTTRVNQLVLETSAVEQLLGEVFEDEAPEEQLSLPPVMGSPASIASSCAASSYELFLQELHGLHTISDLALQGNATSLGLMPSGTIEWANELAYDLTGEPVLEENGLNWDINAEGISQLLLQVRRGNG